MIERVVEAPVAVGESGSRTWSAAGVRARALAARPTAADRVALAYWGLGHLALLVLAYAGAWVLAGGKAHEPLTGVYERWDAVLLRSIAQYGYWGGPGGKLAHPHQAAFFPGYPLALAVVHALARNWVASELLLSLVAGAVAAVALSRLAGSPRVVLLLLAAPASVFLMVGYSESLFLALAVPAWLAATHGRWSHAGMLGFFAALTRPDGLFLLPALAVMAVTRPQGPRWRALAGLAPSLAAPLLYEVFLYSKAHRWSAWFDANREGWGLHWVGPWQALKTSYWGAWRHPYGAEFAFMEQLEIVSLAVMLVAVVVFAARRQWPEAVFVGLAAFGLGTQTWYQSVPRTLLVLFPVWVALSRAAAGRVWLRAGYLWVCGPLAVVVALMYLGGAWAG